MKKKYINTIYISIIAAFILAIISLFIPSIIDYYLKDKTIVYCYKYEAEKENIRLVPVIMFRDINDKNDYLNYYKFYKTDTNTVFHFEPYLAPYYESAYILGYSDDSTVVKILYKSQLSRSIFHFWVAKEFIHKSPPQNKENLLD